SMANITLGAIRDYLKAVADWATGQATVAPKVQLSGSNVMQDVRTLSTTPLGANEFYTQTAQIAKDVVVGNVRGVAYIGAMVYADVPGVLMLQELHGSTWMDSGRWPVGGGER